MLAAACKKKDSITNPQPMEFVTCPQTHPDWPSLADSPWPMSRHDPQHTGRSPYRGPQTGQMLWSANPVQDWELNSHVIIGPDGTLYYVASRLPNKLIALNPDGSEKWRYVPTDNDHSPYTKSVILRADSSIYYVTSKGDYLCNLSKGGTPLDTVTLPGNPGPPTIVKDTTFYFVAESGPKSNTLYAIQADGTVEWSLYIDDGFASAESPVISPDGNTLYLPGRYNGLYAVSTSGQLKWHPTTGYSTVRGLMTDAQGNIYFSPDGLTDGIRAFNPDGTTRWEYLSDTLRTRTTPTIGPQGNFYLPANSSIVCLDYAGQFRWSCPYPAGVTQVTGHLTCDNEGTVYAYSGDMQDPSLFAVDSSGQMLWTWTASSCR